MNIKLLLAWFDANKRDLPWRINPTPYSVWVSEVMLQQTQVAVVVSYFERWMQLFPTINHLANATLDQVLKAWEGLGYYSRARNLHEGAKFIVERFNGKIPNTFAELAQIKGLGPYTIGAILSFAFHQQYSAVDANVVRVICRSFNIEEDIAKTTTIQKIREKVDSLLPNKNSWLFNEALIELGALICQKKPLCYKCPLQESCSSYRLGKSDQLPFKSKKVKIEQINRAVAVIQCGNEYLVQRGIKGKIMSDLLEFPYFDLHDQEIEMAAIKQKIKNILNIEVLPLEQLQKQQQAYTRFRVTLYPILFKCQQKFYVPNFEWNSLSHLQQFAFSSGHKRILNILKSN